MARTRWFSGVQQSIENKYGISGSASGRGFERGIEPRRICHADLQGMMGPIGAGFVPSGEGFPPHLVFVSDARVVPTARFSARQQRGS
ncbi:hypothetical protein, partial [Phaeospirillum tilakii]